MDFKTYLQRFFIKKNPPFLKTWFHPRKLFSLKPKYNMKMTSAYVLDPTLKQNLKKWILKC